MGHSELLGFCKYKFTSFRQAFRASFVPYDFSTSTAVLALSVKKNQPTLLARTIALITPL